VWKISPPPEFDPRTVHPVASLHTDKALPAHTGIRIHVVKLLIEKTKEKTPARDLTVDKNAYSKACRYQNAVET
jgi:hypothetical protein